VLALISVMHAVAIELGYLPEDHPNPARGVTMNAEQSRDRYVTEAEAPKLLAAIQQEENPHLRAAYLLYLLTGLRRSELAGLRWQDVDMDAATLRLPTSKAGRPHRLPLSAAAMDVLRAVPKMLGNPYVLASPARPKAAWHPDEITKRWRTVAKRAGVEDVHLHDLRRTVGSWLVMSGASLPLVGAVLNHTTRAPPASTRGSRLRATRTALEQHGARIAALMKAVCAMNADEEVVRVPVVSKGEIIGHVTEVATPIPQGEPSSDALRDEGRQRWATLAALIEAGKYPTNDAMNVLVEAIYWAGVEPESAHALYVINLLLGRIRRSRGNDGQRRKKPGEFSLRWFYQQHLYDLQLLRQTDPKQYAKLHGGAAPHLVARKMVAAEHDVGRSKSVSW
jgi:hypothetical protein